MIGSDAHFRQIGRVALICLLFNRIQFEENLLTALRYSLWYRFPFTTREPHAGMMDWEDVKVQLIDTPPITPDVMEGYLSSVVRAANAAAP